MDAAQADQIIEHLDSIRSALSVLCVIGGIGLGIPVGAAIYYWRH